VDMGGGGVEGFQGSFCSLFCCCHLMVVTTADPICTASPIFLISQPTTLPTFSALHWIAGMEPTPFSPSHPVSPQHTGQGIFRRQMFSTCPSCLMLPASLIGKELLRCHTEMIPWTAEFATSVVGRGGMRRVMIWGGKCARFDAVVLNAYKGCLAQDQEDRERYLRPFQCSLCISTCPPSTHAYSPDSRILSDYLTFTFPHLPVPTLHHFVPALSLLFLRFKDGSTIGPISRRNCISLGASRTPSVAYVRKGRIVSKARRSWSGYRWGRQLSKTFKRHQT
jgi:hypothetical protein